VLTHDQCLEYRLPRTPLKESERRAATFEARFGEGATELDALEALHPGELHRILRDEIRRYHDDTLLDRIHEIAGEAEAELERVTRDVMQRHAGALKEIEIQRKIVEATIERAKTRTQELFEQIERDLSDAAQDIDAIEWPDPHEGDEDADPLFDSTRGYVEQVDRYKEHQGRPTTRKMFARVCAVCETEYQSRRADGRSCSPECRRRLRYLPGGERARE
jgi:hypothetical protein